MITALYQGVVVRQCEDPTCIAKWPCAKHSPVTEGQAKWPYPNSAGVEDVGCKTCGFAKCDCSNNMRRKILKSALKVGDFGTNGLHVVMVREVAYDADKQEVRYRVSAPDGRQHWIPTSGIWHAEGEHTEPVPQAAVPVFDNGQIVRDVAGNLHEVVGANYLGDSVKYLVKDKAGRQIGVMPFSLTLARPELTKDWVTKQKQHFAATLVAGQRVIYCRRGRPNRTVTFERACDHGNDVFVLQAAGKRLRVPGGCLYPMPGGAAAKLNKIPVTIGELRVGQSVLYSGPMPGCRGLVLSINRLDEDRVWLTDPKGRNFNTDVTNVAVVDDDSTPQTKQFIVGDYVYYGAKRYECGPIVGLSSDKCARVMRGDGHTRPYTFRDLRMASHLDLLEARRALHDNSAGNFAPGDWVKYKQEHCVVVDTRALLPRQYTLRNAGGAEYRVAGDDIYRIAWKEVRAGRKYFREVQYPKA